MKNKRYKAILCAIGIGLVVSCSKSAEPLPEDPGSGGNPGGTPTPPEALFSLESGNSQCLYAVLAGTYTEQTALNASHAAAVVVIVTRTGKWSVTTDTINGMSFSGSGSFTETGRQPIVLKGAGKPVKAGTFSVPVKAGGSNCRFDVTVTSNSTAYIMAIKSMQFSFNGGSSGLITDHYQSTDNVYGNVALSLSRLEAQGDTVVAKLVNAGRGTITAWDDYYSSQAVVAFSNVNNYGTGTNLTTVDTAGKIQIWIYRKDGNNIVAASGNKPPIKTIIQVPGKFNDLPIYSGAVTMTYPYFNPWYNIDARFMENLFASTDWKLGIFNRKP